MFKLYKHQKKQNKKTIIALKTNNHVLYGAATGFGKSVALWDLISRDLDDGKRVLLLAPYRKLIFQLESTFENINPHVVMGVIDRGSKDSGLILSSMDTMNNRLRKGSDYFEDVDKIYIDEAHISCNFPPIKNSRMSRLYNKYWLTAQWVGFTATPIKANGYRLEGWDKVIYKYQTPDLIEMGYLAKFDYFAPVDLDISSLRTNNSGDYVMEDVEELTNTATAVDSVKKVWKKHGKNKKKVLIFAASIKHAELLSESISGSLVIHSKLSDKVQMQILEDFKNSSVGTLINVGILTTGFDDPTVDMLIIARPIGSDRLYLQVAGRSLRKYGNKRSMIFDMCSCYKKCGLPSDIRDFNKVKKKTKDDDTDDDTVNIQAIRCPLCDEVSPRSEYTIETITKKKFILTNYTCPACNQKCKMDRKDLAEINELQKVDTKAYKKLDFKMRKSIVTDLVQEFTKAKPSWSHYIVTTINKADKSDLLDQMIGKGTSAKTLWKKVMNLYEECK